MHRPDFAQVAGALRDAATTLYNDMPPGSDLAGLNPSLISQVLTVVAGTMADTFARNQPQFNREWFFTACDITDPKPAPSGRKVGHPIAFTDVREGDCLWLGADQQQIAVVGKVTDKTITLERLRCYDQDWWDVEISGRQLRRSAWSRYQVTLADPDDMPEKKP